MPGRAYGSAVIARVARFEGQPDRFTTGHAYRYVFETLESVPGFVAGYHLAGEGDSLSVTLWLTEEALRAGEAALSAEMVRLNVQGAPPDSVELFHVVNERGPTPPTSSTADDHLDATSSSS